MGASYHGYFTWHCYNDCRQEGCPGHRGRLVSKHGGYYIERLGDDNVVLGRTDLGDISMLDAAMHAWKQN